MEKNIDKLKQNTNEPTTFWAYDCPQLFDVQLSGSEDLVGGPEGHIPSHLRQLAYLTLFLLTSIELNKFTWKIDGCECSDVISGAGYQVCTV